MRITVLKLSVDRRYMLFSSLRSRFAVGKNSSGTIPGCSIQSVGGCERVESSAASALSQRRARPGPKPARISLAGRNVCKQRWQAPSPLPEVDARTPWRALWPGHAHASRRRRPAWPAPQAERTVGPAVYHVSRSEQPATPNRLRPGATAVAHLVGIPY